MTTTDPLSLDHKQTTDLFKMFSYKEVVRLLNTSENTLKRFRRLYDVDVKQLRRDHRLNILNTYGDLTNESLAVLMGCGTAVVASLDPSRNPTQYYLITKPDGSTESVINLAAFCREHNLNQSNMYTLLKGGRNKTCKGYTCKYLKD